MASFLTGFFIGAAVGGAAVFYGGPLWAKLEAWIKTWRRE